MLPVDLDDLERDILETFEEIGDTYAMRILTFQKGSGGFYNEDKQKSYKATSSLTGRIRLSPTSEEISDIGRKKDCTAIFTFATRHLKDEEIAFMDDGAEVCTITDDDLIEYKKQWYKIVNVVPTAMIGDRWLLYKFECIGTDKPFHIIEPDEDGEDIGD